jgi:hypothetical protein
MVGKEGLLVRGARMDSAFLAGIDRSRAFERLAVLVEAALFVAIALAGVFGLVRRLQGGIDSTVSALTLGVCGGVLAILVSAQRLAIPRRRDGRLSRTSYFPIAAVILAAAALSLPGSSAWGLLALWGLVTLGATVAHRRKAVGVFHRASIRYRPSAKQGAGDQLAADIRQSWIRRREGDGTEVVEGWIGAEFSPWARVSHVYATFCPPFASTPEVEAEPIDGPPATAKIGPVYPHGARVEIRLDRPAATGTSVAIAMHARGRTAEAASDNRT